MKRNTAAVCMTMLVTTAGLAACSSSSGKSVDTTSTSSGYGLNSPQSYAYDACQQHSFGGPGLLVERAKDTAEWPGLNSADVTVTGSGTHYTVSTTVVIQNDFGNRLRYDVNCQVTRRPGNRWAAVATADNMRTVP